MHHLERSVLDPWMARMVDLVAQPANLELTQVRGLR
jgi:hypothetical protein